MRHLRISPSFPPHRRRNWLPLATLALLLAAAPFLMVSPTSAQTGLAAAEPANAGASSCLAPVPGADLRHCDFAYRSMRDVDLAGVDLRGVNLAFADLSNARLSGARLDGAVLTSSILRNADLRSAVFVDADLRLADLIGARLQHADASGAELSSAALERKDLLLMRLAGTVLPEGMVCDEESCPLQQRSHDRATVVALWQP